MAMIAFLVLAAAVLLGTMLAILHLRVELGRGGALAARGLAWAYRHHRLGCLVLALRDLPSRPPAANTSFAVMSAVLIALAALLGGGILATHLFKRRPAGTLIGIHATIAVCGFVVLAAYLFAD